MDTTEGYYVYAEGVTPPIDPCPKGGHHSWDSLAIGTPEGDHYGCAKCGTSTYVPPSTEQVSDQETWDKWIHARYEDLVKNYIDDEGDGSLTFDDFCTNEWVKSQGGQQVSNLDTDRPNRCKVCNCDPEWCTCKKPEEICRDSGHNWVGHETYRVHCKRCGEPSRADVPPSEDKQEGNDFGYAVVTGITATKLVLDKEAKQHRWDNHWDYSTSDERDNKRHWVCLDCESEYFGSNPVCDAFELHSWDSVHASNVAGLKLWRCSHCFDEIDDLPFVPSDGIATWDMPECIAEAELTQDKCSLGDQHVWTLNAANDGWVCKKCGVIGNDDLDITDPVSPPEFMCIGRDAFDKLVDGYEQPKKKVEGSPVYRDLIEVPEHYHLWRDNELRRVFLTVPLDNDDLLRDGPQYPSGTWLRKFAFSDLVWDDLVAEDARSCDDGEARAIIQGCVNDIVAEWRERFGAP